MIVVRDPGPGFDPAAVPNPIAEENLYSTHGRGTYLIRQLMDEAWFERRGSEIHMALRQDSSSGASARRIAPASLNERENAHEVELSGTRSGVHDDGVGRFGHGVVGIA
jgi:hypothetical protein